MRRIRLPVLLAALAATAVNLPIVRNFFFADDFDHLVFLQNYGPLSFIVQPHAGHMYLVRNTVFWLHHALFHATDDVDGRHVFFTSMDPDGDLEHGRDRGGRLERLLHTPDDCPPHDLATAAGRH